MVIRNAWNINANHGSSAQPLQEEHEELWPPSETQPGPTAILNENYQPRMDEEALDLNQIIDFAQCVVTLIDDDWVKDPEGSFCRVMDR